MNGFLQYESGVETDLPIQLSGEYTRKLFTKSFFFTESSNLNFASMRTKLNLVQYVEMGIMSPNEIRAILNLAPREVEMSLY